MCIYFEIVAALSVFFTSCSKILLFLILSLSCQSETEAGAKGIFTPSHLSTLSPPHPIPPHTRGPKTRLLRSKPIPRRQTRRRLLHYLPVPLHQPLHERKHTTIRHRKRRTSQIRRGGRNLLLKLRQGRGERSVIPAFDSRAGRLKKRPKESTPLFVGIGGGRDERIGFWEGEKVIENSLTLSNGTTGGEPQNGNLAFRRDFSKPARFAIPSI